VEELTDISPGAIALRKREPAAFAELVHSHERIVSGLGQSIGLSGAELEDAVAEVFAAVFLALPKFEGRSSITTWVYQIAGRTLRRWAGRRGKHRTAELPGDVPDDRASPPDHALSQSETNDQLWAAVAKLQPRQAMAVELYYRRQWTVQAIAQAFDCPRATVKTLLFRARNELRRTLDREDLSS
jgi:RNA polymerase sigma-70 factor, ECF subfamily